jgi:hypothetical protein
MIAWLSAGEGRDSARGRGVRAAKRRITASGASDVRPVQAMRQDSRHPQARDDQGRDRSCSSVLAAAHDAWVAFDCVALGEFDRLVPYPADVPTQYRVLVPEDQQFSVLRQVPAGCQDSQAEYPAN